MSSWVVIGAPTGVAMDKIMPHFPPHRALVDELEAAGEVLGIGPFTDLGNLSIFRTQAAAERFMREDPFGMHGCVSYTLHEWRAEFPAGDQPTTQEAGRATR